MQVATYYKEVYQNVGQTIAVPKDLQNQTIEVHFLPVFSVKPTVETAQNFPADSQSDYGTGDKMVSYFADVPLPESIGDDFILPERKPLQPLEFT